MIDDVDLVNMNGRVYDPQIGRFMSADPTIDGGVYDTQGFNRYSYAKNNPLSGTDPTGYSFWKSFLNIVLAIVVAVVAWYVAPLVIGALGFGVSGAAAATTVSGVGLTSTTAAINAGIAGAASGAVTGGGKGALTGFVQGLAFGAIGFAKLDGGFAGHVERFALSGTAGGVGAVANGGKFFQGFLSAGVGSFAGPLTTKSFGGNLVIRAALGGAGSILGGGKFGNGAITAAFAYLTIAAVEEATQQADRYAERPDIDGPEIPPEERKKIIDDAIATYRKQPGYGEEKFWNRYNKYAVRAGRGDVELFDTLDKARAFVKEYNRFGAGHVSGRSNSLFTPAIELFAGAAYAQSSMYGQAVDPAFFTLFVIWHERAHLNSHQGGNDCWTEICANKYAHPRYKVGIQ